MKKQRFNSTMKNSTMKRIVPHLVAPFQFYVQAIHDVGTLVMN